MPYLMTMGERVPPLIETDKDYWQDSWGHRYDRILPFYNGKTVDEKFIPKSAVTKSDPTKLPPLISRPSWWCDDEIRSKIESMEPGKHKFFEFHIRNLNSPETYKRYNLLQICVSIPAIIPENQTLGLYISHKMKMFLKLESIF